MPSIKMQTKVSAGSLKEKSCLSVCQKSSTISKKSGPHVTVSRETTEFVECYQRCEDGFVHTSVEICTPDVESDEAIDQPRFPSEGNFQFQKQSLVFVDSGTVEKRDSTSACTSNLETIFSPALEPVEIHSIPHINDDAGSNDNVNVPRLVADDSDDNRSSCEYQTCNVSDFFISDMIISSLPFDGRDDDIIENIPFPDYKCAESSMFFDVAEEYMMLPFLEDTAKMNNTDDMKSCEEGMTYPDNTSLYLAINQIRSCNQESDFNTDPDPAEEFDPQLFIKNLPELSDVESLPAVATKESCSRKSVTLVLDLDETLVHSTLEHCDDADFTFTVFFNMKEHTVYVKQRPHLHRFLERVADMFEVVIFTASQSIYAAQLLDILDPDKKLISHRVYRESCIFADGSYTKDLTVLGVDLAKVAIIDNSPQVFRLQINNGIPIKSWFDDQSDCALISLLPFLETLVDADDVRPIIAKRFGNKE